MNRASESQNYEIALENKRRIEAIAWLTEKQKMERDKKYNEDIISFSIKSGRVYLMLFNINRGMLENKQSFVFDKNIGFLDEFILQYYSENRIPRELILPKEIDKSLRDLFKFRPVVPEKGVKKRLLDLVDKNIELQFFSGSRKLKDLKDKLRLYEEPHVIEAFDISHLSGTSTVASMVQFRNAIPDKSNYRRFRIRSVEGVDDFSSIGEVITRRYRRLLEEKQSLPNLIIVDGGKGQLSTTVKSLDNLGIRIPVIAIAKREEEVFVPGRSDPVNLPLKSHALNLIKQVRDEAHRFALAYNRLLRKKEMLK
jgi:excinuclease ABC subunit C